MAAAHSADDASLLHDREQLQIFYPNEPIAIPRDREGLQLASNSPSEKERSYGVATTSVPLGVPEGGELRDVRPDRRLWLWVTIAVLAGVLGLGVGIGVGVGIERYLLVTPAWILLQEVNVLIETPSKLISHLKLPRLMLHLQRPLLLPVGLRVLQASSAMIQRLITPIHPPTA